MERSARDCGKFEELVRRRKLTDLEIEFCLSHIDDCSTGIHRPGVRDRTLAALLKEITEPPKRTRSG